MQFGIKGQIIVVNDSQYVVSDTHNYLSATFDFSAEWDGLTKTATFTRENTSYNLLITDGKISPDQHLDLGKGVWEVSVAGVATNGETVVKRITTNTCDINVHKSGVVDGEPFPDSPQTPGETLLAQMIAEKEASQAAKTGAEEAKEDAITAKTAAETAKDAAVSANFAAQIASGNATIAEKSAVAAKNAAETAKNTAVNASTSSHNAKIAAEEAKEEALAYALNAAENAGVSAADRELADADVISTAADAKSTAADAVATAADRAATAADREAVAADRVAVATDKSDVAGDKATVATDKATAAEKAAEAQQALTDLLAMLGTDVASLVGGKIPMSQIPATATQEIYEISSVDDLTGLNAQHGDLAELVEVVDGERTVTKTWQLLGQDAAVLADWVVWGTSYAVQAGNATTAGSAENAAKINGHRLVEMQASDFTSAAKDADTYYIVWG